MSYRTHNLTKHPLYRVWWKMMARCYDEDQHNYHNYGGRGIRVCNRWHMIKNFIKDMGEIPPDKPTIERIDNDGGYSPSNCEWATWTDQARNRRVRKKTKSGHIGISKISDTRWRAYIGLYYKTINIGSYRTCEDATEARRLAEIKYWGK